MSDIIRHKQSARMSQIVISGNIVHLAGQIADDCTQDIQGQTKQVFSKIDDLLATIHLTKSSIMSVQIWIDDKSDFSGMNEAWDAWVDIKNSPTRATCVVGLLRPGAKIEIIITAALLEKI